MKSVDDLEESLKVHFDGMGCFEREIIALASTRLTKKQMMMLRWIAENYREEMVYTNLIERISKVTGLPRSTVRWNMRGLRDAGIISAGDKDTKGVPVRLTGRGSIMLEYAVTDSG
jgi:DNA-binding transcriptional ArsR family regulator